MNTKRIIIWMAICIAMLTSACSGSYPEFETGGCDINQFSDEEEDRVTLAEFSMLLVEHVRDGKPTEPLTDCLANISINQLEFQLDSEEKKKAFWMNIYNAYVQILLLDDPELFEDRNSLIGYNFFSSPQIPIAGRLMSLDDLEHGIMRRSTNKLTLGYMRNWFIDDVEKRLMWDEIDPRIHFALNCGAKSCPYIAVFDPDRVEEQLTLITRKYLNETTEYNPEDNVAKVTRLISWFRGDFGGLSGAKQLLRDYGAIPEDSDPKLTFQEYDWTLELGNYQDL
tara:strand:- start:15397 stop:16242 length:846 start_codon:yes stop_codon:yes gene_type:complete